MSEWLKEHAWKACKRESVSWVRIPLSPNAVRRKKRARARFVSGIRIEGDVFRFEKPPEIAAPVGRTASVRREGIPLSLNKEKTTDIHEIRNYREALRAAENSLLNGRTISLNLIKGLHQLLMQGVRGQNKSPGEFRNTQNWIGSKSGRKYCLADRYQTLVESH